MDPLGNENSSLKAFTDNSFETRWLAARPLDQPRDLRLAASLVRRFRKPKRYFFENDERSARVRKRFLLTSLELVGQAAAADRRGKHYSRSSLDTHVADATVA